MQNDITPFCPQYRQAVELIGRKWTGAIIRALLAGASHFSELSSVIPGVSDRLISVRLKELETQGVVERVVIPDKPVRIEYRLTPKGEALSAVVVSISEWAEDWSSTDQPLTANEID